MEPTDSSVAPALVDLLVAEAAGASGVERSRCCRRFVPLPASPGAAASTDRGLQRITPVIINLRTRVATLHTSMLKVLFRHKRAKHSFLKDGQLVSEQPFQH